MNEEKMYASVEEWMEKMNLYMLPDNLRRITSNENTNDLLSILVSRIRPKEEIRKAKRVLLFRKLMAQSGQKQDDREPIKELELMKKRNILRDQIKPREEEFVKKKREFSELVKENEKLLQEIQLMSSYLSEQQKKVLFLMLNEKGLVARNKHYSLLHQSVNEIKDMSIGKSEKQTSTNYLDHQIMEAVSECQTYILNSRKEMKEQQDAIKTTAHDCNVNSIAEDRKHKISEFVAKKLEGHPLYLVFKCVLEQQQQLNNLVRTLSGTSNLQSDQTAWKQKISDKNGHVLKDQLKRWEIMSLIPSCADKNDYDTQQIDPQMDISEIEQDSNKQKTPEFQRNNKIMEEVKFLENRLQNIDKCIEEKKEKCKNLKVHLQTNLAEILRRMSWIKRFLSKLQPSEVSRQECVLSAPLLDDLFKSMKELCELGPKEIQLFATVPLVALEKLTLTDGRSIPAYELSVSYLKILSSTSNLSVSSFPVMNDAVALTSYGLLLHLWTQLSYLVLLQKAHASIRSVSEAPVSVHLDSNFPSKESQEIGVIKNIFVNVLSSCDSKLTDVSELINIMWSHPLTELAKQVLVDGTSLQDFLDLCKKVKPNVSSCDIVKVEEFDVSNV